MFVQRMAGGRTLPGGRRGEAASHGLSARLHALQFRLGRLKTGTPPRLHGPSIDYTHLTPQPRSGGSRSATD